MYRKPYHWPMAKWMAAATINSNGFFKESPGTLPGDFLLCNFEIRSGTQRNSFSSMKAFLFIFLFFFTGFSYAQDTMRATPIAPHTTADTLQGIRLVTLHPLVGEKIDSTEKVTYHLFPFWPKEDFACAYIIELPNNTYKLTEVLKNRSTTIILLSKADVDNMHYQVSYYGGEVRADNSDIARLAVRVIFGLAELAIEK